MTNLKEIVTQKINERLSEAAVTDQTLKDLAKKHNITLTSNKTAKEFEYNDEIAKDFKKAGYQFSWNGRKMIFDISHID